MIAALGMIKALGLVIWGCIKPFGNPMTWPALLLVFGVGFCKGDAYRDRQWVALVKAERAAQEQKLREADEAAFKAIEKLATEKEQRDARIAELSEKLKTNPVLKRGCLSPDVVRAINRALSR